MPAVADVTAFLDRLAPPATAAGWDNVGLLLGSAAGPADRVVTCLTVTPEVVAEAVREKAGLIVSHHPILFKGAKRLTAGDPEGKLLLPLLRAGVAVHSPHTAFDNCPGGINDILCDRLAIKDAQPLRPREGPRQVKLAVYVPEADLAKVSDALFAAGAGAIGKYNECSFRVAGTGTFFAGEGTNPAVGARGRREEAAELRLEVVLPEHLVAPALLAMRAAHSYEEPAYDVYQTKAGVSGGEGRVGDLAKPSTLGKLAKALKAAVKSAAVHVVGDAAKPVRRVAVACGAAGEFLPDAARAKADAFVTGEMRFHDALLAQALGVGALLPGHYASERPGVEELAAMLSKEFPTAAVWASRDERDPLAVV